MDDSKMNTSAPNLDDSADDNNDGITMVDVLEEQAELEEDANAVLGDSDAKNCTYPEGYVKRQALYACLTCLPENGDSTKMAGVCLACSYSCHEKHNLIELYTKRNFRCDCGNSLFGDKKCVLQQVKDSSNEKNKYNQNFRGTYCTCARPYPDPDDNISDAMIQCIMCEDWYHCRHLESPVPAHDEYGEMICKSCMAQHPFLQKYSGLCVTKVTSEKAAKSADSTPAKSGNSTDCEKINKLDASINPDNSTAHDESTVLDESMKLDKSAKLNESIDCDAKSVADKAQVTTTNGTHQDSSEKSENPKECSFAKMKTIEKELKGATFWPDHWRKHLCICVECRKMYADEGVEYLLDNQDTVHAYEERGKQKNGGSSQYDQAMNALQQMDRVNQMEAILGYNDLKDSLKEYLKTFAERKRVVREEDIREFFSSMEARKRQRLDVPAHSCR